MHILFTESEAGECTYYVVAPMDIIEAKVNISCIQVYVFVCLICKLYVKSIPYLHHIYTLYMYVCMYIPVYEYVYHGVETDY